MVDYNNILKNSAMGPSDASAVAGALNRIRVVAFDAEVISVTGGGTTTPIGFQLQDGAGNPVSEVVTLKLDVFSDSTLQTADASGDIGTATAGTIVSGGDSGDLIVTTSATGKFTATLTNAQDETVYVAAGPLENGSPILDCSSVAAVTFAA